MTNGLPSAETAVTSLLAKDEDQLLAELAIRSRAQASDPAVGLSFDPDVRSTVTEMGALDELVDFGSRLFNRWNRELNNLVCGDDPEARGERAELGKRLGLSDTAAAAYLATLIYTSLGLTPALAAVAAAIIIKRFATPAIDEFCIKWRSSFAK